MDTETVDRQFSSLQQQAQQTATLIQTLDGIRPRDGFPTSPLTVLLSRALDLVWRRTLRMRW